MDRKSGMLWRSHAADPFIAEKEIMQFETRLYFPGHDLCSAVLCLFYFFASDSCSTVILALQSASWP